MRIIRHVTKSQLTWLLGASLQNLPELQGVWYVHLPSKVAEVTIETVDSASVAWIDQCLQAIAQGAAFLPPPPSAIAGTATPKIKVKPTLHARFRHGRRSLSTFRIRNRQRDHCADLYELGSDIRSVVLSELVPTTEDYKRLLLDEVTFQCLPYKALSAIAQLSHLNHYLGCEEGVCDMEMTHSAGGAGMDFIVYTYDPTEEPPKFRQSAVYDCSDSALAIAEVHRQIEKLEEHGIRRETVAWERIDSHTKVPQKFAETWERVLDIMARTGERATDSCGVLDYPLMRKLRSEGVPIKPMKKVALPFECFMPATQKASAEDRMAALRMLCGGGDHDPGRKLKDS